MRRFFLGKGSKSRAADREKDRRTTGNGDGDSSFRLDGGRQQLTLAAPSPASTPAHPHAPRPTWPQDDDPAKESLRATAGHGETAPPTASHQQVTTVAKQVAFGGVECVSPPPPPPQPPSSDDVLSLASHHGALNLAACFPHRGSQSPQTRH